MRTIDLIQGTEEWKAHRAAHFNASDAPAMMGMSKYKTRSQLLKEMATGIVEEIDVATERRFADGHRFEALARPLAEEIIGDSLSPVTGTNGKYSASFDGITFDESIIWEHKTLNNELRGVTSTDGLPSMYLIQMEHQLMVSGADKCLFMATRWDGEELAEPPVHFWYTGSPELRKQIIAGWEQFADDLSGYRHTEAAPEVIAAPVQDLPALSIQVNGSISLISNLEKFGARLNEFVANINKDPTDDQGFADAEAAIKTLQNAQDALEAAESNALAQTSEIDDMRKTVKLYADTARTARLMLEKMVKARKETIRAEIVQKGKADLDAHISKLNARLGKPYMPAIPADFSGAIKGKKTLASLREAVNNEYLRVEREASAIADKIEINLNSLRELAKDHAFLFSDAAHLVSKANDDLVALIKVRISEHKAAEAAKEEALRARLQAEEEAKARAKVEAEERARISAETKRQLESQAAQRAAEQAEADKAQEARNIEERRKAAQVAEHEREIGSLKVDTMLDGSAIKQPLRPSDDEIIDALSLHFRVHESKILEWLLDMDMEAAGERIALQMEAA